MRRQTLASILCKREGGKSEIKIGDARQLLKLLVEYDAECICLNERPSPLEQLCDEADALSIDPKFLKKLKSLEGKL